MCNRVCVGGGCQVYREEGARGVQWSTQLKAHSTLRAIGGPPAPNKFFQLVSPQTATTKPSACC